MPESNERQIEYLVENVEELKRLKRAMSALEERITISPEDLPLVVRTNPNGQHFIQVYSGKSDKKIKQVTTKSPGFKQNLFADPEEVRVEFKSREYRIYFDKPQ